jgi:hypothetical protein
VASSMALMGSFGMMKVGVFVKHKHNPHVRELRETLQGIRRYVFIELDVTPCTGCKTALPGCATAFTKTGAKNAHGWKVAKVIVVVRRGWWCRQFGVGVGFGSRRGPGPVGLLLGCMVWSVGLVVFACAVGKEIGVCMDVVERQECGGGHQGCQRIQFHCAGCVQRSRCLLLLLPFNTK